MDILQMNLQCKRNITVYTFQCKVSKLNKRAQGKKLQKKNANITTTKISRYISKEIKEIMVKINYLTVDFIVSEKVNIK